MAYGVELSGKAERELKRLTLPTRVAVSRMLDRLAANPRRPGVRRVAGTQNLYRARAGDYRILYVIHETRVVVHVVRIAHRSIAYRHTQELPPGAD